MNQKCILVADDDRQIRDILSLLLSGEGYRMLTATDGGRIAPLLRCPISSLATERQHQLSTAATRSPAQRFTMHCALNPPPPTFGAAVIPYISKGINIHPRGNAHVRYLTDLVLGFIILMIIGFPDGIAGNHERRRGS